jgi:alkanesulfonate monooxygenase SsuD/methylene tetrahydromethanopterin reductase-like flavin-dependent oxidoreductase (luciferase family)
LAAEHANFHFARLATADEEVKYAQNFNERLANNGRSSDSLKILPGIVPWWQSPRPKLRKSLNILMSWYPNEGA